VLSKIFGGPRGRNLDNEKLHDLYSGRVYMCVWCVVCVCVVCGVWCVWCVVCVCVCVCVCVSVCVPNRQLDEANKRKSGNALGTKNDP
jgi:hypothetical protein